MNRILDKKAGIVFIAVICNLLWGSAYPGIRIGYELSGITDSAAQKMFFAGLRFVLAGLMVLAAAIPVNRKIPRLTKENTGIIMLTGLVYTACQYVFFYIGLSNTSGANGSIVNSSTTFIALIAGRIVYKETIGIRKLIGALMGFAGVVTVLVSGGMGGFSFTGEGFILCAAICFVIGSMISKRANCSSDAMTVTGYNLLIGGIILLALGFLGGGMLNIVDVRVAAVLLYLAFLSAAAFTLWTMLLKRVGIGSISLFNFIIPVSGTVFSAIFMHESIFEWRYALSLILVCAGILTVNSTGKYEKA